MWAVFRVVCADQVEYDGLWTGVGKHKLLFQVPFDTESQ